MLSVKRCIKKQNAHLVIKGFYYYEPLRWQGRLSLQENVFDVIDQDHVFDVHVADQHDEQRYGHDGSLDVQGLQ